MKTYRIVLTALFVLLTPAIATAITNIENERLKEPEEGLTGQMEFAAKGASGNTDKEEYGLGGKLLFKQHNDLLLLIGSKDFGKNDDVKNVDKSFLHARWVHRISPALASEIFSQYQDNEFTRLESRVLTGAGARFTLIKIPEQQLFSTGLGAFYVTERLDLTSGTDQEHYWRFNSYAAYKSKINEQVSLLATAYYQPRIGDFSDYNILMDASLLVKMNNRLKLRLAYGLRHDSEPPQDTDLDIDETDTEYNISLVYQF